MRTLAFDVVIDCELFARVSSIFSFLSGAPVRVGFFRHTQEGLYRGTFINRQVMYNPYTHLTQQFVALADAIESRTIPVAKDAVLPPLEQPAPLQFPAAELEEVSSRLDADFPGVKGKSLVLVSPSGGILPIRAWPSNTIARCARVSWPTATPSRSSGSVAISRTVRISSLIAGARTAWT